MFSVSFKRGWDEYKEGFGAPYGEHWQGNQFAHQYTTSHLTEVILEGTAFDDEKASVKLSNFRISGEPSKYAANFDTCVALVDTPNTNGCEKMDGLKNMKFTTFDSDNDKANWNCAALHDSGGWWFKRCFNINLNGKYQTTVNTEYATGIHYFNFRGFTESLRGTKMLLRRQIEI